MFKVLWVILNKSLWSSVHVWIISVYNSSDLEEYSYFLVNFLIIFKAMDSFVILLDYKQFFKKGINS